MQKIAIIVGSTRPNRRSRSVAEWVLEHAALRNDADFEIVDLADHQLPHLCEPKAAAMSSDYDQASTVAWSRQISRFDGFVFVTPEYNHSIPGVLKNALDHLYAEWRDKAAGCVGYGVDGGIRAVEHLRLVLAELRVATVRDQVALSIFDDVDDADRLAPRHRQVGRLDAMLNGLISWSEALATVRATEQPAHHDGD